MFEKNDCDFMRGGAITDARHKIYIGINLSHEQKNPSDKQNEQPNSWLWFDDFRQTKEPIYAVADGESKPKGWFVPKG